MQIVKSFGFALATGVLFALSLPPFNLELLGWFALAPLMIAIQKRSPIEAIGLGLIAGVASGVIHAGWNPDSNKLLFAYMPFLWIALLFGGVAVTARSLFEPGTNGLRGVLSVAVTGIAWEWLTTWLPLPINVALCQYRQPAVIQIVSVTGIWGVSFLIWFTNAAIADSILRRRVLTLPIKVALSLVFVTLGFGSLALPHGPGNNSGSKLRVAAIQDYTGRETGDLAPPPPQNVDAKYREGMTREVVGRGAQLVVWSEESLGSGFLPQTGRDPTVRLVKDLHTHLVVGYSDSSEPKPFNCAAVVSPDGTVVGVHHKNHLFLGESASLQPGHSATAFPTALGKVGLEVCFDSIYTDVTRRIAGSGAQIIAMPNFDPPTPHGVLHRLHGAMLPFRAAENHIPFVRCDSNGLSQIIDANGRIVGQSKLYQLNELEGSVALGDGRGTFFTRFGDWLAYLCLLFAALRWARQKWPRIIRSVGYNRVRPPAWLL